MRHESGRPTRRRWIIRGHRVTVHRDGNRVIRDVDRGIDREIVVEARTPAHALRVARSKCAYQVDRPKVVCVIPQRLKLNGTPVRTHP